MADRPVRTWIPVLSKTNFAAWPMTLSEPSTIFVPDIFLPQVDDDVISVVFAIMGASKKHQFVLASRFTERMAAWFAKTQAKPDVNRYLREAAKVQPSIPVIAEDEVLWVPENVAVGAIVRNQADANKLVPHILKVPVTKFVQREGDAEVSFAAWKPAPCKCATCGRGVVTCFRAKFPIDWMVTGHDIQSWPKA